VAGPKFELFLAERVEVSAIVEPLGWGWSEVMGCFQLAGRDWDAYVYETTPMSWEDAPPEAVALQAGIAWHVEAGLDGSEVGLAKTLRALRAIAKAGHGVIADDDEVWRPGRSRRTRWSFPVSPLSSEAGRFTMGWWTIDPAITTEAGAAALVETLGRVLPEAMPARWGDIEPYPLSFETEGPEGLARFIASQVDDLGRYRFFGAKLRPPFSEFSIVNGGPPLGRFRPVPGLRNLQIEAGASVLRQPGWGRQLAAAFSALLRVARPFYAEARLDPNATWDHGWSIEQMSPLNPYHWWGFPHAVPMAMVIGPPYTGHWHDGGGTRLDDMIAYSSDNWPVPPPGGVPVASADLLQEFDPWWKETSSTLERHWPMTPPPIWPFD